MKILQKFLRGYVIEEPQLKAPIGPLSELQNELNKML